MYDIVRAETKKSVCHVCGVQIGVGNEYAWTIEGKAYNMRHPTCEPAKGIGLQSKATPETTSAETAAKLATLGLKLKRAEDKIKALEKSRENVTEVSVTVGEHTVKNEIRGTHARFREALELAMNEMPVYLHGPQASGKSKIAEQIAESYGCPLHAIELKANTPNSAIMGFVDANGKYHSTPVRRAAEAKGPRVLLIEEMDNASDMHLVGLHPVLDAALDGTRRKIQFPDEAIEIEPGLIVVATGNTAGFGGTIHHVGRRPFDSATASRFAYIQVDYDEQLEDRIASTIYEDYDCRTDWVRYIRQLRKHAAADAPQLVICMRAIIKGLRILKAREVLTLTRKTCFELADSVLFRGIEEELRERLHRAAWADASESKGREEKKAAKPKAKHTRKNADRGKGVKSRGQAWK